jgi:DNA-binding transcriptional ArsR family regulator
MRDARAIPPGAEAFVEAIGLYFEKAGMPRIGGRLLGLLLVSDGPRSLDDIATALRVSRASVSTNVRMLTATGLVELVSLPGDRRDYYVFSAEGWERHLQFDLDSARTLGRLVRRGLDALAPEHVTARRRLEEAVLFSECCVEALTGVLERWRARAPRALGVADRR